jgi:hypothetical protein
MGVSGDDQALPPASLATSMEFSPPMPDPPPSSDVGASSDGKGRNLKYMVGQRPASPQGRRQLADSCSSATCIMLLIRFQLEYRRSMTDTFWRKKCQSQPCLQDPPAVDEDRSVLG